MAEKENKNVKEEPLEKNQRKTAYKFLKNMNTEGKDVMMLWIAKFNSLETNF